MDRYDPRRIACPHCRAPVGAWCAIVLAGGRTTDPVEGSIHHERSRDAGRNRRAGAVPDGQRKLPGID